MVKNLGFCELELFDNYLTCVVNEGVTLTIIECRELIENALHHFVNKPFVYITHRINSYAVDPSVYTEAAKVENLLGFAVVSQNHLALKNADIEKLFFNKPFESFKNLESAEAWAESIIKSR